MPAHSLPHRRDAGCRNGSIFRGFARQRRTWGGCAVQFRLTPQVVEGDHPGQDAQSRLHRLSLTGRALRGCSPLRFPDSGPGLPGPIAGTVRFDASGFVSHILSLGVWDWASVSSRAIGFRIMSFT